jgi:signal transduction histidine kinase
MSADVLLDLALGLAYLFIFGLTLRRRDWKDRPVLWLTVYTLSATAWSLMQALARLGWLPGLPPLAVLARFIAPLFALFFLQLTRAFVRADGRGLGWWLLAGLWMAALLGLPSLRFESLNLESLNRLLWGVFTGGAIVLTARTHQRTPNPLHRNRLKFWVPVIALMVLSEALRFAGQAVLGAAAEVSGLALVASLLLTHRLPDVRQAARRALNYSTGALVASGAYALGFLGALWVNQNTNAVSPIALGLLFGLLLTLLLNPLIRWAQARLTQWLAGAGYDPAHTLREYSLSISNILDLDRLAALVVGLIRAALGSAHGALFLVDGETPADGPAVFHLRRAGASGDEAAPGHIAATSPVAVYFSHERRPLTQYDIDLLPQFRATASDKHGWLAALGMDVFVPIYAKNQWIGLLALGPKLLRDRYFDDDLVLLSTLADQTAMALENARLVDDLQRVNDSLAHANAALEKANEQLQELDKLKSVFIGVITHELRTPFANIILSLQVLQRQGQQLAPQHLEQLLELAQQVNHLKRMVDDLIAFSTFLSKQGELKLSALDFAALVRATVEPLATLATAKGLALHTNIEEHLPGVTGDATRLTEAIHHLVQNAIQYNRPSGEIWVHVWAEAETVHLEVKDTGVGVPAEKLPGLWDAFAQMADPLKRGAEGLGLGLALVKYVVTAHGGEVSATSTEGVGSAFGFQLPARA